MGNTFRTKPRDYCIFCIIDKVYRNVFVGKSFSKNPRSHYFAHLRGEYELTEEEFRDPLAKPEFIVLEYIKCTGDIAFKHVIAWYDFFEENGYCVMVGEKMGVMIDYPSPMRKEIYDTVCAPVTLEDVLTRTVIKNEENCDKSYTAEVEISAKKSTQLNIRVKEDVKHAFKSFCEEKGLTQSDALRLLLLGEDFKGKCLAMQSHVQEQKNLENQIAKYKHLYEEMLQGKRQERDASLIRRKEWTKITRDILHHILCYSIDRSKKKVKTSAFSNAAGYCAFRTASYPEKSGVLSIYLDRLVYGRTSSHEKPGKMSSLYEKQGRADAPLFVIGRTFDGKPVKFRWYPRKDFIGMSPRTEEYAYHNSRWLLGYIIANDGAANLVAAIPYDCIPGTYDPKDKFELESEGLYGLNIPIEEYSEYLEYDDYILKEILDDEDDLELSNDEKGVFSDKRKPGIDEMIRNAATKRKQS